MWISQQKVCPPFWRKKASPRLLLSRNLPQNKFSIDIGYDCRSVSKHVLKSYDIFFYVHNSRKQVVGLIYMQQFMS